MLANEAMGSIMAEEPKHIVDVEDGKNEHHAGFGERVRNSISSHSMDENTREGQIFSMNDVDPALDAKMRLVNKVSAVREALRKGHCILTINRRSTRSVGRVCI